MKKSMAKKAIPAGAKGKGVSKLPKTLNKKWDILKTLMGLL